MMLAKQLDHLVLTVRDIDSACSFYEKILGMKVVESADGRKALFFGRQKINLHQFGKESRPHARYPSLGAADLCFLTDLHMAKIVDHLVENQIKIVDGPVERTGAQGPIISVYFRDNDGNLIEIANQLITSTPGQKHAA